jgi:hypothetical protein
MRDMKELFNKISNSLIDCIVRLKSDERFVDCVFAIMIGIAVLGLMLGFFLISGGGE